MTKIVENGTDWKRMATAISYLTGHYQEQPRLEEAAEHVGLSPFHFQRIFTRYIGVSPKAFVGHLTLAHAKAELSKGASVLAAALEAGLSGPSRLHDLCLKVEAMTPGDYAKGGAGLVVDYGFAFCPFGLAIATLTDKGLCGLGFGDDEDAMLADMRARWPKAVFRRADDKAADVVAKIFDAENREILPLYLMGTPFQVKVWQALLAIPSGEFSTYGAIAESLKSPKACRAVGAAVGRNPISWLIPCHRALGASGALTGYHWGVERKRAMLAVEAAKREMVAI
ncbi:AraC family transcriptional regulator of adaptative response/methylated-DNA-[protein]-cysteine methyltransferase [Rhizomicrobium palustre]|uniref:methylated-DNA--[protein]-cysteine S-methyltransferase n=1 Tax=Rhizomicrobium palustre TaxID=189966 RepID=A0A846MXP7_9PROT|nr:methylated-DNA--[protein]-cysteine S-methyltransferase [Rhizomicrobium palustre]NIK88166.1 AraC family transcriptional regulator of adaptative response/methylated-DNA-[protein]-cysteine methyltransferase [Rhizomicrobium palustre]